MKYEMRIAKSRFNQGFTLIEMLVVITITMLMLGGGIAAYINFNEKQQVLSAAKRIQIYLRGAQNKARVGDRPTGCDRLLSYTVTAPANNAVVQTSANCDSGDFITDQYTMTDGVKMQTNANVIFRVLHGGAVTSQGNFTVFKGTRRYQFFVTPGGEITEGAFIQ